MQNVLIFHCKSLKQQKLIIKEVLKKIWKPGHSNEIFDYF